MLELRGKYGEAKIFTDLIEEEAIAQLLLLLNQPFAGGSQIRIMPDVHSGAGCVIGTTMTIKDSICPNLVGVDLGCGILAACLGIKDIDLTSFDDAVKQKIPAGFSIHEKPKDSIWPHMLYCNKVINMDRAYHSVGTLGGGNHFIEVARDSQGILWLLIHTGSRNLGKQVAEFYQKEADILHPESSKGLAFLEREVMLSYLHDIEIAQNYAIENRERILLELLEYLGLNEFRITKVVDTIHNYVEMGESLILRKGAISAYQDEELVIPMNREDGTLLCVGKGNEDWNFSAPHGAGRIMSRSRAKKELLLEDSIKSMKNAGVYSSTVSQETLDEDKKAYKPMESIIKNIEETVDIIDILKPIYNFKG